MVRQVPITGPLVATTATPNKKEGFIILSRSSGLVLEVTGNSKDEGAKIQQAPDNGQMNQHWNIARINDGSYVIQSFSSGLLLEVAGAAVTDHATIQQFPNVGGQNQHWELIPVNVSAPDLPFPLLSNASKFVKIRNRSSGKVLDVPGKTAAPNVAIQQLSDVAGNHNQEWQLVSVGMIETQPQSGVGGGGPVIL